MALTIRHYTDENGDDAGGTVVGPGISLSWPGPEAPDVPGVDFLELLAALISRLQHLETISSDPDRVAAIADLQAAETDLTP